MPGKQWVLITGATSGIGLETALLLASHNYNVIATARTQAKAETIHACAKKLGISIHTALVDVTDALSIAKLKEDVLALTEGYGIDVLVNNAGYAEGGAIEELPVDRLRNQFETNVFGLVAVTQNFIPFMRSRKAGKVINISSVVGKISLPLLGAYTATKHAVEALSAAMRVELVHAGIQVVIVAPGSIKTNFGQTLAGTMEAWYHPNEPGHFQNAYDKLRYVRRSRGGASPRVIANTILKIVQAKRPRARYAVPIDSLVVPIIKTMLPTKILDLILEKIMLKN